MAFQDLSIEDQQNLINSVQNVHQIGLVALPVFMTVTLAAVFFTRRNRSGNIVLGLYFLLSLVFVGTAPDPLTMLWLGVAGLLSGSFGLLHQHVRMNGLSYGRIWQAMFGKN